MELRIKDEEKEKPRHALFSAYWEMIQIGMSINVLQNCLDI